MGDGVLLSSLGCFWGSGGGGGGGVDGWRGLSPVIAAFLVFWLLLLVKIQMAPNTPNPPRAAPTPMPAFTPMDNAPLAVSLPPGNAALLDVEMGIDIVEVGMAVFELENIVVLTRSEIAYRTRIECAFIPFVVLVTKVGF